MPEETLRRECLEVGGLQLRECCSFSVTTADRLTEVCCHQYWDGFEAGSGMPGL